MAGGGHKREATSSEQRAASRKKGRRQRAIELGLAKKCVSRSRAGKAYEL
jgi:hypothetical protein